MTEIKPATDEEIERLRRKDDPRVVARGRPSLHDVDRLIARIDAERERAEKAENGNTKLRERLVAFRRACREVETDNDILAAQLAEAQQQIAALREALEALRAVMEDCAAAAEHPTYRSLEVGFRHSPLTPKEMLERYQETCRDIASDLRAALAQTEGAEG